MSCREARAARSFSLHLGLGHARFGGTNGHFRVGDQRFLLGTGTLGISCRSLEARDLRQQCRDLVCPSGVGGLQLGQLLFQQVSTSDRILEHDAVSTEL